MNEVVGLIKEINQLIVEEKHKQEIDLLEKDSQIDSLKQKTLGQIKCMNAYSESLEEKIKELNKTVEDLQRDKGLGKDVISEKELVISEQASVIKALKEDITQLKLEITSLRDESKKPREILMYNFGQTSRQVMSRVVEFIEGLFNEDNTLKDPLYMKSKLQMSEKEYKVITDRLLQMDIKGEKLFIDNKGSWSTSFDKETIIKHISKLI